LVAEIDERVSAFLSRHRRRVAPTVNRRDLPGGEGGQIVSTTAIIIAVAVNTDGRREMVGVATRPSEAKPFWKALLARGEDLACSRAPSY